MRSCAFMSPLEISYIFCQVFYRPLSARSIEPATRARARDPGEIVEIFDIRVTQLAKQLDAAISLIVSMFQEQPAARAQPFPRLIRDSADVSQSVLAGDEGKTRLEALVALLD